MKAPTGAQEKRQKEKGVIDYILKLKRGMNEPKQNFSGAKGESSEVGMREGREGGRERAVIQMKSKEKKMPNVEKELQCLRVPGWAWVRAGVNKPTA